MPIAWRIPGTGEPGGLLSMGSHRVGHDCSDSAAAAAAAAAADSVRLAGAASHERVRERAPAFCCCSCSVAEQCPALCPGDCSPLGAFAHGVFPGRNTGLGCCLLLQGSFWTQGWNPHHLN